MTRYRFNSDEELRSLERAARLGDERARARLAAMYGRHDELDPRPAVLELMRRANKGARADIARINERQVATVLRLVVEGISEPPVHVGPQHAAWSWLSRRKRVVMAARCQPGVVVLGMAACAPGSGSRSHTDSNFWSPWFAVEQIGPLTSFSLPPASRWAERRGRPWRDRPPHAPTHWMAFSFPHRNEGIHVRALDDASALEGRPPAPRFPRQPADFRQAWAEYQERLQRERPPAGYAPAGRWRYVRSFYVPDPDDAAFFERLAAWCRAFRDHHNPNLRTLVLTEPQAMFLAQAWR